MEARKKPISKEQQDRIKRFFNHPKLTKEINVSNNILSMC